MPRHRNEDDEDIPVLKKRKFAPPSYIDRRGGIKKGQKQDSFLIRRQNANKKIALVNYLVQEVQQLVIVASFDLPKLKLGLVDRFIVLAEFYKITPIIVFTKEDLVVPEIARKIKKIYNDAGYQVYLLGFLDTDIAKSSPSLGIEKKTGDSLSNNTHLLKKDLQDDASREDGASENLHFACDRENSNLSKKKLKKNAILSSANGKYENSLIDEIREETFAEKKTAVVGHSGVGKTTMLRGVDKDYQAKTSQVSILTGRGRHTTSRVCLHEFSFGGVVFDMPGIKEIDYVFLPKDDLKQYFLEFKKYAADCRFANCTHINEKDCAVKKAIGNGVSGVRYRSYKQIFSTLS